MPFLKRSRRELRPGSRVVAVQAVGAIPEGTLGTVKLVDGFEKWIRYWVAWESGEWTGSIDGSQIVAVDRLDEYKQEQAEAAERALAQASAPAAVATEAEVSGGDGGGSRVPEHLLERSRQARARKAAQSA